ncbi:MAG: 2-oxoacid:acceptor oxidoreductase family protein [Synergistales bacterium]|nr:2-oxoacid:acceptor oxidoreductase family protein [Synergistales bacterium]
MRRFDIYLTGVGGQGIGLLSEVIIRAGDHAGLPVSGVDTHGLAQRGGMVVSHVRFGALRTTPLVRLGSADLVIALEISEAMRALHSHARPGGTLVFYDTAWQTLSARLGKESSPSREDLEEACRKKQVRPIGIRKEDLQDHRMQNMVLLGRITRDELIPGIGKEHYEKAMDDLMAGSMLEANLKVFREMLEGS